jgi:hypothetical protein
MKVKIAFDWDKMAQKEIGVELNIPEHIAKSIIKNHFNKLDYSQRQTWIHTNLPDKNVKHISEDEL